MKWEEIFSPLAPTVVKPAAKISLRFTVLKHPTDNYRIHCNFFSLFPLANRPNLCFNRTGSILECCCPLLFSLHTDDVKFGFLLFFFFYFFK